MIFPLKLWRLVNDKNFNSAIRWAEDGLSFYIFENRFQNMCLGKENNIFYTKNTKSFVRQLHLYGFRKINKNQFRHQSFQRDQPDQLQFIKRSYKPIINCNKLSPQLKADSTRRRSRPDGSTSSGSSRSSSGSSASERSNGQDNISCSSPESILAGKSANQLNTNQYNQMKLPSSGEEQQVIIDCYLQPLDLNLDTVFAQEVGVFNPIDQIDSAKELTSYSSLNAMVISENLEDSSTNATTAVASAALPLEWYENSMVDVNYNCNEDSVLTMYNNDIYPNTCADNNITL